MKKTYLFIIILIVAALFAASDYFLNVRPNFSKATPDAIITDEKGFGLIKPLLVQFPDFQIIKRNRTTQLFEKFDLSSARNIRIYRNEFIKKETNEPIVLYEMQGPAKQGSITYLNTKLKMFDQLDPTEGLNEISNYGNNSFFFNDFSNERIGFLLVQVGDNLFGFQYQKENEQAFGIIERMIDTLMRQQLINS